MSKTILISAGHGMGDPGAIGNGFREADIALMFRNEVAALLRSRQVLVLTDGSDGENEPLTKAIEFAKRCSGRAVELHLNASVNSTATGVEALSLPNQKPLAQKLAKAVSAATGLFARGDKGWKDQSSGQHHRLGFCMAGGVILELAFISNPDDMDKLMRNKNLVVTAIASVMQELAEG